MYLIFGDVVYGNIEQLFSKETGYNAGEIQDVRYTLAGRGYVWENYWNLWLNKQPLFFQIFGDGINRPAHNEFLRILLISGIIGVVIFVFFIIRMFLSVFKANREYRLFGLMILTMFLVDCTGLMPGNYYFYNILIWGLVGLISLNKSID
jgi:O-antigen ligase